MNVSTAPMRRLRFARRLLPAVAILLFLAFAAVSWWGSEHMVSPKRRALQDYHLEIIGEPERFGLRIESYTGPDATPCLFVTAAEKPGEAKKSRLAREELARRGVPLPPWKSGAGTVILLHGHQGRKEDHLPICERFCAAGFRCIVPDIPGQGDHPSACATFGRCEAPLAVRLADDAARRFNLPDDGPVFLFGVSQGGAIALQAAALAPERWAGVASIAAFSSLDRPLRRSAEEILPDALDFLSPVAAFGVGCGTRLRAGFWPADIRPINAAARLHLPVFIAHGDLDTYIGIDQGRELFAALPAKKKRFRVVEGADHNRVLSIGSHALYADVCQFFLEAATPAAGMARTAE